VAEVVAMGEVMIRLAPPDYLRLEQTKVLNVEVGGAEFNLAAGLSQLGLSSAFISKLVDNPLGRIIANRALELGVDISRVVWTSEGRIGLYFVEFGRMPRPSFNIYDRKGSAINYLKPDEVDWDFVGQAKVLHISGITVALSESCEELTKYAIRRAKESGVLISFDVNYRSKLWSPDEAREKLGGILGEVDILFSTCDDLRQVFGVKGDAESCVRELKKLFSNEVDVVTAGGEGSWAYSEDIFHEGGFPIEVVDRLGAGDAFAAGFLYGYLQGDIRKGLKYGGAMAAIKHTIPGDQVRLRPGEIEGVIGGASRGIER